MTYWTIKDAAAAWGLSCDRVREYAVQGRIPGAYKEIEGRNVVWRIPAGAPRPEIRAAGRPKIER